MHPELEKLMDFALADGEVSEKELKVLRNKAEALGVDQDELEMVLEAKLHLAREESTQAATPPPAPIDTPTKRSTKKEGVVNKCPACGASVESFSVKCADCGHEFRGVEGNTSATDLMAQLDSIAVEETELDGKKPKHWTSEDGGIGLVRKINARKAEKISMYPVPNTKEDLLEFMAIAFPLATAKLSFGSRLRNEGTDQIKTAWLSKCSQLIIKARFALKGDPEALAVVETYAHKLGF